MIGLFRIGVLGSLFAGLPCLANAQSFLCPYQVASPTGGWIEASGIGTRSQSVGWRLPTSNSEADLNIAYRGQSLDQLGAPTGGNIRAHFPGAQRPKTVSFTIEDGTGWVWSQTGKVGDWGVAGQHNIRAYIEFDPSSDDGRHLLESAGSGRQLQAKVEADGVPYTQVKFGPASASAHKQLLAQLRRLAMAGPPPGCKTASGPIRVNPVSR